MTVNGGSEGEGEGTVEAEARGVDDVRDDGRDAATSPRSGRVALKATPAPMSATARTTARAASPLRFDPEGCCGSGGGGCVSLICLPTA